MKYLLSLFLVLNMAQPSPITRDELLGKFNPADHPDFVQIDKAYTNKSEIYLRKQTYDAFERMHQAAKLDDVNLTILSATRNFQYQKGIWERKWERKRYMGWQSFDKAKDIMTYSSMPGTSRHHWGTDIDLNSLDNAYFVSGKGKREYDWLLMHGPEFGFHQVYTSKDSGRTGYNEEKWHWSYMPLSKEYLKAYNELVKSEHISGFRGAKSADSLDVISNYVFGIDGKLKD